MRCAWVRFRSVKMVVSVIDAQPEEIRVLIRVAFDHRLEAHRTRDGFELPVVAKLASGRVSA